MTPAPTLIADLGGTSLRFALSIDGSADQEANLDADDYADLPAALAAYLARHPAASRPRRAIFAVAGPQDGETIVFTNRPWSTPVVDISRRFGFESLEVVNDFAALAMSLPYLRETDRVSVGPGRPRRKAPMAVVGPGTGLGVAGLLPKGAGWRAVPGEGGHATLGARTDLEADVLAALRRRYDHVSAERVLSGQGLCDLHQALCEVRGHPAEELAADAVTTRATDDPVCADTVGLFTDFLATVASDVALVFDAEGGVFIGGGIVPRLGPLFDAERFRARFIDKGRFSAHCDAMPTWLITHPYPGLVGLAHAPLAALDTSV